MERGESVTVIHRSVPGALPEGARFAAADAVTGEGLAVALSMEPALSCRYRVDAGKHAQRFGDEPTPFAEGLSATIATNQP